MPRSHDLAAGERSRVFRRRFSSLPLTIRLITTTRDENLSGTVERIGSRWVLGRTRSTVPLEPEVVVSKGFWDTFFDIEVTSDVPVTVRVDGPSMRSRAVWALAAVAVAVAAIAVLTSLR